jgi:aspartate/tyrosine/aromatic aminotransferase
MSSSSSSSSSSVFADVPQLPPDAIFNMKNRFVADADPRKVNLTVGAYATAAGKELVLDEVRRTEQELVADPALTHSYLKIVGDAEFSALSCALALGRGNAAQREQRVAHVQALSGTGALRLLSAFLANQFPGIKILKSDLFITQQYSKYTRI